MTHRLTQTFVKFRVRSKTNEINSHINSVTPPLPRYLASSPHQLQRSLPDTVTRDLASASLYVQCWSRSTTLDHRTSGKRARCRCYLFFVAVCFFLSKCSCSVDKPKCYSVVMARLLFFSTICVCLFVANAQFGKQVY